MEAVPPFLIQELRGGNLDHLRPILALYGQEGRDFEEQVRFPARDRVVLAA